MKSILLLFNVLMVFVSIAQSPVQTIRGKIVDEAAKSPIAFALVEVKGTVPLIFANSDPEGNFKLENVPVGRYEIQISAEGYDTTMLTSVEVSSARETVIDIALKENISSLGEVVLKLKVAKEEALNPMATVSARMLSVEEAKRYAGGFDDPARLASSFAGVSSNVANNGIVVRGNAPKFLQWKMEGVEIPNPNHFADLSAFGGGGLTALSSQMLANSDFFTGAFPAEYSNALSGIFDINMRKGNSQNYEHTFQIGLIGIDLASEGPFKKEKPASYLFNYRYSTLGLVSPLLPAEARGTQYQDLSFKIFLPTKSFGKFSLWGIGLIDRSGQVAEKDSSKWYYLQNREEADARQYMGASGITHEYFINENTQLKTTIASTVNGLSWNVEHLDQNLDLRPQSSINNVYSNFILNSSVSKKFSSRHNNKTGITITGLNYNLNLKDAVTAGNQLRELVSEKGSSVLYSVYTSSAFHFTNAVTANVGVNAQFFSLNGRYTIEPRLGIKWQVAKAHALAVGYGLHSRLERINYYFSKAPITNTLLHKNLDFTKAHHFVLSHSVSFSEYLKLRIEPYYQYLFSVPVVEGTSFSFINLQNQWFFNQKLTNKGEGRNYGVDLTLEKYISKGYYFLFTSSLFDSKYKGGDGVWRNTLFNRNYLFNLLAGKEWRVGKNKKNAFGLNARLVYQGGDRYTPIDEQKTLLTKRVQYDEENAFSKQLPASFLVHSTVNYKINNEKVSHEIAFKILNATGYGDFFGFRYNYLNRTIDEHREAIVIPNLSYKIEF